MNSIAFAQKQQSVTTKSPQAADRSEVISVFNHPLNISLSQNTSDPRNSEQDDLASHHLAQSTAQATTFSDAQLKYRNAMSGLAAAVNIITTAGDAGQAGFTASAVCSVTDNPPTLLVCLNRNASVYDVFKQNQVLSVNTLAQQHTALSQLFGGKTPMVERFKQGCWQRMLTGAPILDDAVVSFDCKVSQTLSVGTHDIFICEVLEIRQQQDAQGLVYFDRTYHQLHKQQ